MNIPPQTMPFLQEGYVQYQWYKFLQQLAKAVGDSTTANDDAILLAEWPDE